jgi:hypothetical protein
MTSMVGRELEMEIAFSTQSLRSICENEAVMNQKLGRAAAQAFQVCLADLRAATTVADVTANYATEFVSGSDIELAPTEGLRVRLRANDSRIKKSKGNPVDWNVVSRLKIMEIAHRG